MRTRVGDRVLASRDGRLAVVTAVVATLLLGGGAAGTAAVGSTVQPGEPATSTGIQDAGGTWNDTYTPGPEGGVLLAGVPTADGGALLVGSFGPPDATDSSAFAVRVDAGGAVEWVWSLQGYGNATLTGVLQRDDGGFLVAGTRRTPEAGPRRLVAALGPDGELAWRHTYGQGRVTGVAPAPDGGALLVGGDTAGVITATGGDVWIAQYEDADVEAAARIGDGYVLAGASTAGEDRDRLLVRIDGTGEARWGFRANDNGHDRFVDVVVDDETIQAGGAAPLDEGTDGHPSVAAVHPNGTHDRSRTMRQERPGETVTGVSAAEEGALAAIRGDERSRLAVFARTVAGAAVEVDARVESVTALGDGRSLLTGSRDGEAFAAVVRPDFDSGGSLAGTVEDGDVDGSSDGGGGGDTGGGGDDSGGGDVGVGVPALPVGGVPPGVTVVLVVAAAVASLAAVAVTVRAVRQL
jgi:hypothetical protein